MNQKVPVFLITGFLESGKTEFLNATMEADYFQIEENTVLFVTEEGIEEFDEDTLEELNTYPVYVEDQEELTPEFMNAMCDRYEADRVIIEWNGMWDPAELKLPEGWFIHQQVMLLDATTFETYYQNGDLRSILSRLARGAEVMIMNRCDTEIMNVSQMKRELMSINSGAEIVMENDEGEIDMPFLDEELPYDLSQEEVRIIPEHYGVFFMDSGERTESYMGKKIVYTGQVKKTPGMKKNEFVLGRVAINGCVDPNCVDVNCEKVFLGYLHRYKNAYALKADSWVTVTAEVKKEFVREYGEAGPVFYPVKVEAADPIHEYVTFG